MSRFCNDYKYGKENEKKILKDLNNFFKDDIEIITDKFSQYDFKGTKNIYELKTRRNKYEDFPTTIIGANKILDNIIFLFKFENGLYYIKYDENKFNTFEKKKFVRNKRLDYNDKEMDYLFIPIEHLTKII
jgi:hypothetical protein